MKIKHLFITRFSNKAFGFSEDILLNINRLRSKLELFIDTCYKSLINQTNQNFDHVVLVHPNCPKEIIEKLSMLEVIVITDLEMYINSLDMSMYDYLITSRIDDDDMLHPNSVNKIQEIDKDIKFGLVGFRNGCTLIYNSTSPYIFNWCSESGFIAIGMSLVQNLNIYPEIKLNIHCGDHTKIRERLKNKLSYLHNFDINDEYFNTINFYRPIITDEPYFIYIRHDMTDTIRKLKKSNKRPIYHYTSKRYNYNLLSKSFMLNI